MSISNIDALANMHEPGSEFVHSHQAQMAFCCVYAGSILIERINVVSLFSLHIPSAVDECLS